MQPERGPQQKATEEVEIFQVLFFSGLSKDWLLNLTCRFRQVVSRLGLLDKARRREERKGKSSRVPSLCFSTTLLLNKTDSLYLISEVSSNCFAFILSLLQSLSQDEQLEDLARWGQTESVLLLNWYKQFERTTI